MGRLLCSQTLSASVCEERGNVEKHERHHEQVRQVVRARRRPEGRRLELQVARRDRRCPEVSVRACVK